jgi:hypothetical protein
MELMLMTTYNMVPYNTLSYRIYGCRGIQLPLKINTQLHLRQ